MNLGSSDDSLNLWRDDDDSSNGNDFENINHWNELDGDYIGDILNEDKEENTTRVYFQNLNGLKWDKHGGIWPMICQSMAAIHADIACFSEVNQDTSKFEIREKMKTVASLQFDHVRLVTATSNRKAKSNYKPGGTTMLTMMDTVALSKDPTRDRMGRWVSTRYSRGNGAHITVIGAYQVCQTHRTGQVTAATQQINQLLEEYATIDAIGPINPREVFIRDLSAFIQQRQQCNDLIVLGGDFNEAMSSTAGLFTIASQCGLVDVFSKKLGTSDKPATFKGGSKRLDYILLSPALEHMVKAIGYEPYDYRGVFSDHRPMFVDFDSMALFGAIPVSLSPATQRDFKASDPLSVRAYVEKKYSELIQHNFLERIHTIESNGQPNHDIAERLDRDMQRAAIIATKSIQRQRRFAWSPKLAKAWALLHYHKLLLSQIRRPGISLEASISSWRSRFPFLPAAMHTTVVEAKQLIREAARNLKHIRQEAAEHRRKHLEDRVNLYAGIGDEKRERIVERLKRAETTHQAYSKLRNLRNPERTAGLMSLQIPIDPAMNPKQCPSADIHWQTIRAPAEIEKLLIDRNRSHFGQAQGTPLTDPHIWNGLKYDGSGQICDLILDGEYDSEVLDEASKALVEHLTARSVSRCKANITSEDFLGKLRHWDENTTTSPSGLHLGHYQALWKPAAFTKEEHEARREFDAKRVALIRAHVALLNYSIRFGYPLQRWLKVVNVMLEKDPGKPRIHRLRVIHIYEADYNLFLAVKWRETLHHAEDELLLHPDAYGSRPARSAHDPVAMEIWRNGIYRTSMKTGINMDLDATSCYDRILPPVASICSRRMGIHPRVAQLNSRMLEKARFHLKTSLGISTSSYTHCPDNPIYGTGQGSGNSPHIWCFISSALFDAHTHSAHGAVFRSFRGDMSLKLQMVGFVDDCTQGVNGFSATPQPESSYLVERMRHDSQLWNDLLWTSGGALELPKCSFQVIESCWDRLGRPFLRGGLADSCLRVRNGDQEVQIPQTGNYESRKTLGVHLNPAGVMTTQIKMLQKKSQKFEECVLANVLTRREAQMLYHAIYLPSVTYPMAVTHMKAVECHQIETKFLQALLPRMGFPRTMSTAIRQAPASWGGAGLRPLYCEQSVATIELAMRSLRSVTNPSKALRINLSWAQAYSGLSQDLWEYPSARCPPVPEQWIMGIRTALSSFNGRIVLENKLSWPAQRANDWHIMDEAMKQLDFKTAQVEGINACRRFLQCVTAADLSNDAGTHILPHFLNGNVEIDSGEFSGELFNQPKPGAKAWRSWRKFWRRYTTGSAHRLRTPLRSWILPAGQCRRRPHWVYEPTSKYLYQRYHRGCYRQLHSTDEKYQVVPTVLECQTPPGYPVRVLELGESFLVLRNYQLPVDFQETGDSWSTYLLSLDEWERNLLAHVTLYATPAETMYFLNDGVVFAASDGSVLKMTSGSFGLVLVHVQTKTTIATAMGAAPGFQPSSFRAEAYGALAVLRLIWRLSAFTGIVLSTTLRHWIDNNALVRRISYEARRRYPNPRSTLQPDWDVTQGIIRTLSDFHDSSTYGVQWIKSHQDDDTPAPDMSLAATANCNADSLAEEFQRVSYGDRRVVPMITGTAAQLIIDEVTVTGRYKRAIRDAITLPPYFTYLESRFGWSIIDRNTIDWKAFHRIIRPFSSQHATLVKHLHGIAPTGKYAHRYDAHQPARCPACECPVECNNHLMACLAPSREAFRIKFMRRVEGMQGGKTSTDYMLWQILFCGLATVHSAADGGISSVDYPPIYHALIEHQNRIGWIHLYRGRWSCHWRTIHESWCRGKDPETIYTNGGDWVCAVGRILLSGWFELWALRNQERHKKSADEQNATIHMVVRSQLREIYSYRNQVRPADRDIFCFASVEEHMTSGSPMAAIQDWCSDTFPAVLASVSLAAKEGVQHNARIQDYFTSGEAIT